MVTYIVAAGLMVVLVAFLLGIVVGILLGGKAEDDDQKVEDEKESEVVTQLRALLAEEFDKHYKRHVSVSRGEDGKLEVKVGEIESVDDVLEEQLEPTLEGERLAEAHKRNPEEQVPDRGPSVITGEEQKILREREEQRVEHPPVISDFGDPEIMMGKKPANPNPADGPLPIRLTSNKTEG
jgi:hypothetical protein